jgi:transcriptional repressor NrdR
MQCPFCKKDNDKVVDSRTSGLAVRRRRQCLDCNKRFTTYERIEGQFRLRVVKKDGTREQYDRQKILKGFLLACHKRPVPTETIEQLAREIEEELLTQFDMEVPSQVIGDLLMKKLRGLDQVAYVRFASVYRNFQDVSEFVQEVEPMLGGRNKGNPAQP